MGGSQRARTRSGPPVFIVGCGRSGTTMLRLMLDAHPTLAIPGETHFLMALWHHRDRYTSDGRLNAEALVREAMRSHQFGYWGVPREDVLERVRALERPDFGQAISAMYMAYADLHGKQRWGDKTPQYVRSIAQLAEIFPGSRFVHVIRDGRDVALSYLSVDWGPPNVRRAARVWREDVSTGRRAGGTLGPGRYLEVRYEELVASPAPVLEGVCRFLDLTFEPEMLEYHRAAAARIGARPDREDDHASSLRPPTEGVRDWRIQMPDQQVRAFESVAGALLGELGYERRFGPPSPMRHLVDDVRSRVAKPRLPGGRRIRATPRRRASGPPHGPSPTLAGRALIAVDARGGRGTIGVAIRGAWPLLPRMPPPDEPIFVLGSPRSGTTMLFTILSASPAVAALPGEGHLLWNLFHPEGGKGWCSQATSPDTVARGERAALGWVIHQIADGHRYLDKTPRNSLQVPYLHRLFPDARFVFMARDGRAVVSSLLDGWRDTSGLFPGRRMPVPVAIDGYAGDRWKFVVPTGWESYATGRTLPEVCAFQWVACTEAILAARERIEPDRWVETSYERFTVDPRGETARVLRALRLPIDPVVMGRAGRSDALVTKATSPPRPDKWRDTNRHEVEGIVPLIAPTLRRLGYAL